MKNVKKNAVMLALCDFEGWSEKKIKSRLVNAYEATVTEVGQFNVLIAFESEGGYEGESHFLLEDKKSGALFEVHASHCSCYGYEGQFEPELTTVKYLLSDHAGWFSNEAAAKDWVFKNLKGGKKTAK